MEVSKATDPGTGGVDLAAQIRVSQLVAVGPALSSNFCWPLVVPLSYLWSLLCLVT